MTTEFETVYEKLTAENNGLAKQMEAKREAIQSLELQIAEYVRPMRTPYGNAYAISMEKIGETAETLNKIQSLTEQLAQGKSEMQSLEEAFAVSLKSIAPSLWLIKHIKQIYKQTPVMIDSVAELYPAMSLQLKLHNGSPIELQFTLNGLRRTLAVKDGDGRAVKGWTPEVLNWVPKEWLPTYFQPRSEDCIAGHPVKVSWDYRDLVIISPVDRPVDQQLYCLRKTEQLMPVQNTYSWTEKFEPTSGYGYNREPEYRNVSRDVPEEFQTLESHLQREVEAMSDGLDIQSGNYEEGSLGDYLRKTVLSLLIPRAELPYSPYTGARQQSVVIYKKIAPYWDGFARGPWRKEYVGLLANLKHYCERGERAHFWNLGLENHFGFGLRTRDHSWIEGEIYLFDDENAGHQQSRSEPGAIDQSPEAEKEDFDVLKSSNPLKFRLGAMVVTCSECHDRDRDRLY